MEVVREPEALRAACEAARMDGERVGFVPTMGALHAGHLALLERARQHASFAVVSIFVNPTQFGPGEDLDRYPRKLAADVRSCEEAGASLIFAPERDAMYPPGDETRVRVDRTAAALCGPHRPEHFDGVCTVVTKLLNLVGPCVAVFGRKDYQQWRVIERMTTDLLLPVEVVGVSTVREPDGLAMSSRNAYLDADQRRRALCLAQGLAAAAEAFDRGERRAETLQALAQRPVAQAADAVDYVTVADPITVQPIESGEVGERALVAMAARVGATRLIDNMVLGEEAPPKGLPT